MVYKMYIQDERMKNGKGNFIALVVEETYDDVICVIGYFWNERSTAMCFLCALFCKLNYYRQRK